MLSRAEHGNRSTTSDPDIPKLQKSKIDNLHFYGICLSHTEKKKRKKKKIIKKNEVSATSLDYFPPSSEHGASARPPKRR